MGKKLDVGDKMPDFGLPDEEGNIIQSKDLIKDGPAVLFFYPKDETRGCTAEACSFRDDYASFQDKGASVVGISSDSKSSHREFKSKNNLPYPLLSDKGGKVRKKFGVPGALFGLLPGRVTYIVDGKGVIRHVFSSMMQFDKHVEEALQVVEEIS